MADMYSFKEFQAFIIFTTTSNLFIFKANYFSKTHNKLDKIYEICHNMIKTEYVIVTEKLTNMYIYLYLFIYSWYLFLLGIIFLYMSKNLNDISI